MSRSPTAWLVVVAAGLSGTWLEARPKPRAERRDSGADEVKLVLQREQNAPIDRRAELQDVLKRQPDLGEARWQSGYVDVGGAWQSYAARPKAVLLANLERYRQEREAVGKTVRDQLALAVWCKREGLRDQERAHRLAAVRIANPAEQQPIFESLGYRQAGGQWLSPQEVNDWERQARAADESLKSWGRQVERLAAQVQGNGGHRARARAALLEIQDPAAVSALE
ncbi:MAG TPA: hypothetical protein VHB77_03405, partial [Planctomycetaceae bacterium]|nr:hypothetical protein [Planctomycetaceae bacterium]